VTPIVSYTAEIDLSDEGQIKMLDAYAGVLPTKGVALRIGQMRVPFSIDAHRSPHKQYFANRSFIAKQVGNVRDVGIYGSYTLDKVPLVIEAGAFNGSGLTNQKNYWTKEFNFSAKAQYFLPCGLTLEASVQKISPNGIHTYLYDGGVTFHRDRWTLEAEYLRKHYQNKAFNNVNAWDAFVCYDLPLKKAFSKVSFLARYDMMNNHSDGTLTDEGKLKLTDARRQRVTGGVTLSMAMSKKVLADIRLNYEKYFYDDLTLAKPSERDKAVVELVVHF
uniref:porin n=1 Tax=Alloprevotella sp. TaxID=1872471 RepID=UPI004027E7FC